jgi:hypothetical protein
MSSRFSFSDDSMILMFSCFAQDPGEAIYKPDCIDCVFAVNNASTHAKVSARGAKLPR